LPSKTINGERERINGELSAAADIQNNMLPSIFPRFSERRELVLYAKMIPAKEVGGDFYDFFYMDEEETQIACVIADVSGKGVPAALFMVIVKTLLKIHLLSCIDPAETLETVNKLLCEDNPQSMFVTVFLCTIDLHTGKLTYANGGHNAPLISLSGEPYQFMLLKKGMPLGLFEESRYTCCCLDLHAGDKLYLYTDGVNEAMNREEELFGNDRFLEKANVCRNLPPEDFDKAIRRELFLFTEGFEQSDDITTLAITYAGGAPLESLPVFEQEITLPAALDNLDQFLEWTETILENYPCSAEAVQHLAVATGEIFVNIACYAYAGKTGDVIVRIGRAGDVIAAQFEDGGIPFDPLDWPDPETTGSIENRSISGRGIFLVKKMSDRVIYRRFKDKNLLTIFKRPETPEVLQ
jgi:sigma-B regulation protein RsbU (phosphoserine phosphatase)